MRAFGRADRSPLGEWWWTVDKLSLGVIGALMAIGFFLTLAAGPAAAERLRISQEFHFVYRQALFVTPAILTLIAASLLSPAQVRLAALGVFAVGLTGLVAALFIGAEINGARRWIALGPFAVQPSEFIKPAFIILVAWALAEEKRRPRFPGAAVAFAGLIMLMALLILQPDYGQTMLLAAAWAAVFFISGVGWTWIGALGAMGMIGVTAAYHFAPHVASRIDRFLDPESGDTYQTDTALAAISEGGLWGRGPGEGQVKHDLPDAHTDFIFAVAGEEFGFLLCFILIALFGLVVLRAYMRASVQSSPFAQYAACGLAALIGLQALINISVNLRLAPAKGMTLPFISYGGSSLIASCLTLGMLLALTRARPGGWRRKDDL